jgi:hypothetical protein
MWDLAPRVLDAYAAEDFDSEGSLGRATDADVLREERPSPLKPAMPKTRPNPKNPNREIVAPPATAYTPGVLNCVRGSPPRVVPKRSR